MPLPPVAHIVTVDANSVWSSGAIGKLTRLRSLAAFVGSNLSLATVLVWLQAHYVLLALPACLVVFGTASVLMLRRSFIHRASIDDQLHVCCHNIRDAAAEVLDKDTKIPRRKALFENFNHARAEDLAIFFRRLLVDQTVTCAIRLASMSSENQEEYLTVARSSGMHLSRRTLSEPIPANKGLPARMRTAEYHGVLIINDIKEAIQSGEYHKTRTDDLEDCRSMMACPINTLENGRKSMLGILCISSNRLNAFNPTHTVSLMAFSDILGLAYPTLMSRLQPGRPSVPPEKGRKSA